MGRMPRYQVVMLTEWLETMQSSGITGCRDIQSKLEKLLNNTNERIARLEEEERDGGLHYKGENQVKCDCGNTFETGGKYGATCDECPSDMKVEKCIDCVKECQLCCEKHVCKNCKGECAGNCGESFCSEVSRIALKIQHFPREIDSLLLSEIHRDVPKMDNAI